ncbi:MAG TPA: ATPase, partial [Candidatus Altiarchaeales archaeon]|nr:ATPase [Candidatus Altiarchaeales archaeon]
MSLNGWHSYELQQVFTELDSSEKGLSGKNASQRLEAEGKNVLESKSRVTPLQILLGQFKDFLIILLIAAAFISIAVGVHEKSVQEIVEAGLILLIVVFIVIVGFYQQYHAEKELEALKNLVTPVATILRDGAKKQVDAENLVLGDIVFLESGDRVPADLRIINSVDLKADESSLTGESTPVEKKQCVIDLETPLAERVNSLYMGTTIVYGKATAIVVSKGMDTELGKIAKDISQIREDKTPLQERLNVLGKQIGVAVIILCAIVFASGYIASDTPVLELFIIAIALAVAAVPEGLPGVVTVALATGTRRMVRHNAIIRKLPAVETLGCTTVICSDKTGTLTRNEMTVKKAFAGWKTYDV